MKSNDPKLLKQLISSNSSFADDKIENENTTTFIKHGLTPRSDI
jgi:hypothetical protein